VFSSKKQDEQRQLGTSAGHIWPEGRMLCMPALRGRDSLGHQITHGRDMGSTKVSRDHFWGNFTTKSVEKA